jgi:UDPglucose 6-dehydrogenase
MNITIFGIGYVGLVTGACLADAGHSVTCVDVDPKRVENLQAGHVPFYEPGIEPLVLSNVEAGRLRFTTDAAAAVRHGTLLVIAVGTPPAEDGRADLRYVFDVARTIGETMDGYKLVVDKSTVPVGTADKVRETVQAALDARGAKLDFDVCSNPEFLKEGAAIEDFTRAPRIVVGAESERAVALMRECYAPYNRNHDKLMVMDIRSAELTKYAANAMLATKISFMNEIANIAERTGADIEQVRLGIGSDPRIGYHFIYPGAGFGGSCFPKDLQALQHTAEDAGYEAELLGSVSAVNDRQKLRLFEKLESALGGVKGKTIAVWGLSFKPNTDDMRDAPSRTLMEAVWAAGGRVRAHDPKAMGESAHIYGERGDLTYAKSPEEALEGADALVICTEWKMFRTADPVKIKAALRSPVVVDGRNLFEPEKMAEAGLRYVAFGRGAN